MNKRLVIFVALLVGVGFGVGVWFFFIRHARPDFDQLGGTILVYTLAEPGDAEAMAKAVQVRVDPDDRGEAAAKVVAEVMVEIRIPRTSEKHAEEVTRIRELVLAAGHLEFLMLANSTDDKAAIDHAKAILNSDDPEMKKQLKELHEKGEPPPMLRLPGEKEATLFSINLTKGEKSLVTYRWVELGPHERRSLNLDKANPDGGEAWQDAQKNLGKAAAWTEVPNADRHVMSGALFYSRVCENQNVPEKERWKKAVEYFVLVRDPEIDPKVDEKLPLEKRRTRALDGSHLASAAAPGQRDQHWFVSVTFNTEGRELLRVLTKKNVSEGMGPEGSIKRRHLAMILDGQILSAPTITSEIPGGQAQISGAFSEAEARSLSAILRAGALPGRLKWFSEREVARPGKARE
jgi:hypothetical protein